MLQSKVIVRVWLFGSVSRLHVHMEPDILLVDEVLAVGDIPFRSKCHRKLGEMKKQGIPWIMVSHDMGTIRNHTNIGIFLEHGMIEHIGTPEDAIANYLYSIAERELGQNKIVQRINSPSERSRIARILQVRVMNGKKEQKEYFETGEPLL